MYLKGLGFGVWGLGFKARVWGLGFTVLGLGNLFLAHLSACGLNRVETIALNVAGQL